MVVGLLVCSAASVCGVGLFVRGGWVVVWCFGGGVVVGPCFCCVRVGVRVFCECCVVCGCSCLVCVGVIGLLVLVCLGARVRALVLFLFVRVCECWACLACVVVWVRGVLLLVACCLCGFVAWLLRVV